MNDEVRRLLVSIGLMIAAIACGGGRPTDQTPTALFGWSRRPSIVGDLVRSIGGDVIELRDPDGRRGRSPPLQAVGR